MKGKIAFIPGEHKIEFHEYDVPGPPAGGLLSPWRASPGRA